jgi:hypothetical protein
MKEAMSSSATQQFHENRGRNILLSCSATVARRYHSYNQGIFKGEHVARMKEAVSGTSSSSTTQQFHENRERNILLSCSATVARRNHSYNQGIFKGKMSRECFMFYFFGGLECVGHSFAYVAHL